MVTFINMNYKKSFFTFFEKCPIRIRLETIVDSTACGIYGVEFLFTTLKRRRKKESVVLQVSFKNWEIRMITWKNNFLFLSSRRSLLKTRKIYSCRKWEDSAPHRFIFPWEGGIFSRKKINSFIFLPFFMQKISYHKQWNSVLSEKLEYFFSLWWNPLVTQADTNSRL